MRPNVFFAICALLSTTILLACNARARSADGSSEVVVITRVLNGVPAPSSDIPQLVKIVSETAEGSQTCTGTVIDNNHVLTAGHCVAGSNKLTVSNDLFSAEVRSFTVHPGYFEDLSLLAVFNDLAVLKLDSLPVPSLPIIASDRALTEFEQSGVLYGFGLDNDGNAGTLHGGLVSIAETTPNHLLSNAYDGSGANACNGDSGAPLVVSSDFEGKKVFGVRAIVSTGSSADCGDGDVTYYTNLAAPGISSFIKSAAPGANIIP